MVKQHASSPKRSGSFSSSPEPTARFGVAVVLRAFLHGYRVLISPLLPRACRFYPSCSQFALEAFSQHSAADATRLTVARIVRCHPWNPGGYDPVPPRKA